LINKLNEKSIGWNELMDTLATEIFEKGFKQEDIIKALEDLELVFEFNNRFQNLLFIMNRKNI